MTYDGFGQRPFSVPECAEPFEQQYAQRGGIFRTESWIVGPMAAPLAQTQKTFTAHQEPKRKEVERLFGVVQGRFKMIRSGNRWRCHPSSM